MPHDGIIIFTRYPRAGEVKTRLVPKVTCEEAARIHRYLAEKIINRVTGLRLERDVSITVCYTGGTPTLMRAWLGNDYNLVKQRGRDLGQRMAAAFRETWARGTERAVLIGTDCPSLDEGLVAQALDHLHDSNLVLGPAFDGGYYLIGLSRAISEEQLAALFTDITWGTTETYSQTLERARMRNLSISTLKMLHDIDRPEDLRHLHRHSHPQ